MDLNKLPLFGRLTERMAWLNQRQEVIARNVANADTPGYVAKDLKPLSFRDNLSASTRLAPVRTAAGHLGGSLAQPAAFKLQPDADSVEDPSGNRVDIEEQMVKLAETQADYQMITNLYRKQVGMIKTAIGRSGGA